MSSCSSSPPSDMASWTQISSLLSPNPDPNAFNGRKPKRVYPSAPSSAASSIRSFMTALAIDDFPSTSTTWGKGKGKLKKQRRMSPPPILQPLSFTSFEPISIPSPSSASTQIPVNYQENPPVSRTFDYENDGIQGNDDEYDGRMFERPDLVAIETNSPFLPTNFSISPSVQTAANVSDGNSRITDDTPPRHSNVILPTIIPSIVTTPSSPTTPSRLPSPLPKPPVPPLPNAIACVTEAEVATMSTTSTSSPTALSTPSSAHHPSAVCHDMPIGTDSTGLSILSLTPSLRHAPQSNHSHSTRSSDPSPSTSTPATSLPPSASLDSEFVIPENTPSVAPIHQVHEVQSDGGHGGAFHSSKRPSLLRNFSLSVGMPSSSSVSTRTSGSGKPESFSGSGGLADLARSKTSAFRRAGRRNPSERPPPPPSSWADVASPLPSSAEGTSLSGHSSGWGGALSNPSSPATSGGGFGGWVSANTSTSDLGSTFAKWRKWRKRRRSSTNGGSQSAFSSRTSLGVEDDVPCVPGLPLSMRFTGEKGKEKEVVLTEEVGMPLYELTSHDLPERERPSLSPSRGQSPSHDGHSLPPRPTPPTPQSLSERSYRDHQKSTSWTDAAASIFLGSARHSNDASAVSHESCPTDLSLQKISRSSSESTSHGHGGVGLVNGRRVLRKERIHLGSETSEFGQPKRRSKAMFTIGNDFDDFIPPMAHSTNNSNAHVNLPSSAICLNASVVALSADHLPDSAASGHSAPNTLHRPPLVRRDALMHGAAHIGRRRWTLADAMTDEGISDVGLVRELERMREVAEWARRRERMQEGNANGGGEQDEDWDGWDEWDVGREILEGRDVLEMERQQETQLARDKERVNARLVLEESTAASLSDSPESEVPPPEATNGIQSAPVTMPGRSVSSPSTSWLMAQRALLTCRELILTERHYLSLLSALIRQETSTPPPPLMVHYAAELVAAADAVLKGMEREPSARGVARAFLERENELECAYTRWCGVVGGWFSGDGSLDVASARGSFEGARSTRKRSRGSNRTDTDGSNNDHGELDEDLSKPLKRSVSTWRKSMPSIPSLGLDNGSVYGGSPRRRDKEDDNRKPTPRRPDVRELAILPTQRVMRYVLLYRDLLSHTPSTSASRPLVERAVDAACRIADKCDRAQGNVAFVVSAASPSSFGVGSRNNSKHRSLHASTSKTSSPSTSRIISSASITGHRPLPVPTTSPALASPPTSAKSTSRPSSPAFGESPTSNNPSFGSRRLSMTAMSFVTLGWNKSQRGMSFGPVDAIPVTAVAPI